MFGCKFISIIWFGYLQSYYWQPTSVFCQVHRLLARKSLSQGDAQAVIKLTRAPTRIEPIPWVWKTRWQAILLT